MDRNDNNTTNDDNKYDVAILGSGITGSSLAAILSRQGLRVAVFDSGEHPRFAIGESMILETSETLRAMAELFDVPELGFFASENCLRLIGSSHGVKRHFGFVYHARGEAPEAMYNFQAVIPKAPYGHELHLFRQDSDSFIAAAAVRHGAELFQRTEVEDVRIDGSGVEIMTSGGDTYHAEYVVDAGGLRSQLAEGLGLRHQDLQTHSRGLFTHMVGVRGYDEVCERQGAGAGQEPLPHPWAEGTLHHVFDGGWLWVIPFDNHPEATNPVCSVGLMLDPRVHPKRDDLSPEEEFRDVIARYPHIARQLEGARSVRPWTRSGRIQCSSRKVVGDRFCLLGNSAGFIDPLYSKGLYISLSSVGHAAGLLLEAFRENDFSAQRFASLEKKTLAMIDGADRLVAGSYRAFAHPEIWAQYRVLWLMGAYLELLKLTTARIAAHSWRDYHRATEDLRLTGGAWCGFEALQNRITTLLESCDPHDTDSVAHTVSEMKSVYAELDWMPEAFRELSAGQRQHLPKRKLRLAILRRGKGFFGTGPYRKHFFADVPPARMVVNAITDRARYSPRWLRRRHRRPRARSSRVWTRRPRFPGRNLSSR